jgi:hypothetical protein
MRVSPVSTRRKTLRTYQSYGGGRLANRIISTVRFHFFDAFSWIIFLNRLNK